jgi:hypothetical protein
MLRLLLAKLSRCKYFFPFQFNVMLLRFSAVVYDKYCYLNFWNDFLVPLNYTGFLSPSYYVFYDLPKKLCSDCYWPRFVGTNILPFQFDLMLLGFSAVV